MRLWWVFLLKLTKRFNPRICKRCDQGIVSGSVDFTGFNPRICKRCDCVNVASPITSNVSIHASVKDATLNVFTYIHSQSSFNPRICKRCDPTEIHPVPQYQVSIHASVKDATRRYSNNKSFHRFQSTHL